MVDGRRLGFWLTHVHGDDDAQVVERGQGRVEGNDHRQPAEPGVDGRDQDVQLGEEADRWRDAGQREEQDGHRRGAPRIAGRQASEASQPTVATGVALQHADHREGGDVHHAIAEHVEQDGLDPALANRVVPGGRVGRQPGQDVAGMRDARVGEHALHVALRERHDVAARHCQHR